MSSKNTLLNMHDWNSVGPKRNVFINSKIMVEKSLEAVKNLLIKFSDKNSWKKNAIHEHFKISSLYPWGSLKSNFKNQQL